MRRSANYNTNNINRSMPGKTGGGGEGGGGGGGGVRLDIETKFPYIFLIFDMVVNN